MINTTYLQELSSPSFDVDKDKQTSPEQFKAYFSRLERNRLEFEGSLTDCDAEVLKAYLAELNDTASTIKRRGFVGFQERDITQLLLAGRKEAVTLRDCYTIDMGLIKAVDKTRAFIRMLLAKAVDPLATVSSVQTEQKKEGINVISGVRGLADYLGCGNNKANDIVQTGILKDEGIQYLVGNCWKFNAKALDNYLKKHPDIFGPKQGK